MRKLLLPIAVVLGLALPAPGLAATIAVKITATGFTPKTVTVNPSDTVKWTNADNVNHQLVANNGAFASRDHQARQHLFVHVQRGRRRSVTTTRSSRRSRGRSR